MKHQFFALSILFSLCSAATAADIELNGAATVSASGDPQTVKAISIKAAKRQAVLAGLNKLIGPNASKDPAVLEKLQEITDNINDKKIIESKGTRINGEYEMVVTLVIDDKDFRNLISDAGIAGNTAAARSGQKILAVMDEFLTVQRDLKMPLEELTEFRAEKGKSFKDKSVDAKSSSAAGASANSSASSLDARASSNVRASGSYDARLDASARESAAGSVSDRSGSANLNASREASLNARSKGEFSGSANNSASIKEQNASSSSAASTQSAAALSAKNVAFEEHDNVSYKKLIKYQPQNVAPEKVGQTYNAMAKELQQYDLQVADNDMFRSKYFKNKPITIEQMQNGEQLAKYVAFARTEAKADYFMVGTTIIIDSGVNPNTGSASCTGVTTVKTYATVGAETIASTTVSEAAEGRNINDCSGNLAIKLARFAGADLGAAVQTYTKRRGNYGSEYVVALVGKGMNAMLKLQFAKALKTVSGIAASKQRESSDSQLEYAVTYKGDAGNLSEGLLEALMSNPAFASLDTSSVGNQLYFCLGSCGKLVKK